MEVDLSLGNGIELLIYMNATVSLMIVCLTWSSIANYGDHTLVNIDGVEMLNSLNCNLSTWEAINMNIMWSWGLAKTNVISCALFMAFNTMIYSNSILYALFDSVT